MLISVDRLPSYMKLTVVRIGRKPVIVIALTGLVLNLMCAMVILWFYKVFPLQLVWVSGVFQLIGGGQAIVAGGVLSILSDVAAEEQRLVKIPMVHSCQTRALLKPFLQGHHFPPDAYRELIR